MDRGPVGHQARSRLRHQGQFPRSRRHRKVGREPRPLIRESEIMLARTIGFSIRQRWLVLAIVALLCAIGAWSAPKLPIDAVPDITNVQVPINHKAEGYSPLEAEQPTPYPLETATAGIPNTHYTPPASRSGLGQVPAIRKP